MILPPFQYHLPGDIREALELLKTYGPEAKVLAGGTDLLLQMQRQALSPTHLVSLKAIPGLRDIVAEKDRFILGPLTTHRAVERSSVIQESLGALHDGAGAVGSAQIRNVATVAGNICNGAPSADTAGPLLALGASVRASSLEGERIIPLEKFFPGSGVTALRPDELLIEIHIPRPVPRTASAYEKLTRRKAMDLAIVGASVCLALDQAGARIQDVRIALTTAAPTPIRCPEAESTLQGETLTESLIRKAAECAASESLARTSSRSTEEYRRDMIVVLTRRAVKRCLDRMAQT